MAEIRTQVRGLLKGIAAIFGLAVGIAAVGAARPVYAQITEKAPPGAGRSERSKKSTQDKNSKTEAPRSNTKVLLSGKYLHLSCSRSLRDLAKNRLECFGNVYIRRPSELLTSDYAVMDLNTEQLHAEGNVVYFTPEMVIYGEEMDFNFITETGVIKDGRIESDKYQLLGERIERLAVDHFKAYEGEYTTCRDCPASWKIAGKTVDLTIDGYAHLSSVFLKINDAPTAYLPYAIIPVKTKRQSGLLFPRIQPVSQHGFVLVQPYFWAISRSQDATLGGGFYSLRGPKGELEYRYMLSGRSFGQLNAFYLKDKQFFEPYQNRWAANYNHNLELPFDMEQKLQFLDASDRDYPRIIGDIPGRGEPALASMAGLSRTKRKGSAWVVAKRFHNLLRPEFVGFDQNTVQVLPSVSVVSTDHRVAEGLPLHFGIQGNYTRFWREGPAFDPIVPEGVSLPSTGFFLPGQTPLRKAQRFRLTPELYYTARIFDVVELMPSVQYRSYYYLFDEEQVAPTARAYLVAQAEVATTVERVYGNRLKHKIRPALRYSNIPIVQEKENHPFIQQINRSGNQLDDFDIVPITNDTQLYFVPLGNSLSYQLGNKFILKSEAEPYTYRKVVELISGQSINFIEFQKSPEDAEPLSRFFTFLTVDTLRLAGRGEFYYYPYRGAQTYNLSFSYIFARYMRRLLSFERSLSFKYAVDQVTTNSKQIGGAFNFSINDYFGFSGGLNYLFPITQRNVTRPGVITEASAGVTYQSPSQCYKITVNGGWSIETKKVAVSFDVPINLTGEGYMNLQDGGGLAGQ